MFLSALIAPDLMDLGLDHPFVEAPLGDVANLPALVAGHRFREVHLWLMPPVAIAVVVAGTLGVLLT